VRSTSITGAAPLNLTVLVPDDAPGPSDGAVEQGQGWAQGATLTSPSKANTSGVSLSKVTSITPTLTLTLTRVYVVCPHPYERLYSH